MRHLDAHASDPREDQEALIRLRESCRSCLWLLPRRADGRGYPVELSQEVLFHQATLLAFVLNRHNVVGAGSIK